MRTINKFLLKLAKPLNDTIKSENGLELLLMAQFNHQWNVTTNGFVHTVPYGVKNVKAGDEVAISFKVVGERKFPSHATQFFLAKELVDKDKFVHRQEWTTAKGYKLVKACQITPTNAKMWVAVLTHQGQYVWGMQDPKEDKVNNELLQFPFGAAQKYFYKNIVEINGETFWRADKMDIYAKRLHDGTLVSVSDRVITEPIKMELTDAYNIVNMANVRGKVLGIPNDRGKVVSAPANSGFHKGDIVGFEPRFNEKYTLWDKEYFLIKKDFVQCVW